MKFTLRLDDSLHAVIPPEILQSSGCYILFSKQWNNGISRLNGRDRKGILYIGKADILENRVSSLVKSINSNKDPKQPGPIERGHKALSRKFYRIREHINTDLLFIDIIPLPAGVNAQKLESYLLESYVKDYAELPSLNGQYGSFTFSECKNEIEKLGISWSDLY